MLCVSVGSLIEGVAEEIRKRVRISDLVVQILEQDKLLILKGKATCFYHKQLAQQAVIAYTQSGYTLLNQIAVSSSNEAFGHL